MVRVIIVAAGCGSRFGSERPKQFCLLAGRPVLMRTVEAFSRALPDAEIMLVISKEMEGLWAEMCGEYGFASPPTVCGGATRWESVKRAVEAINPDDADIVMVHDGARPIVGAPMLGRILAETRQSAAAIPVVPVTDSLRKVTDGGSLAIDRSTLRAVQTPQAFSGAAIKEMYALPYSPLFTDDASVYEAAGLGSPRLVDGDPACIKITHPSDLAVAEALLGLNL